MLSCGRAASALWTNGNGTAGEGTHNDDSDLSDGGSELLGESSGEEGGHEGKGGGVDLRDEGGGSEELDGGGDLLNGVDEGGDQRGDELLDILVGDERAKLGERSTGGLLDIGLGVWRSEEPSVPVRGEGNK
jgi:hypothetical protein